MKRLLPACLLACALTGAAQTFDFRNDAALYGALDNQAGPVTFTNSGLVATFAISNGTMNQASGGFGINASISGDDTDAFDIGEWLNITFDSAITLTNVDVSSWGSSDEATLYVNGISNGVITSSGNHSFSINVPAGQPLRILSTAGSFGNGWSLDSITVDINAVTPTNAPPILNPIGNQSLTVSNALNFSVTATDANNDPIVLSASNLPPGAVFNTVTNAGGVTNSFSWASAAPVGVYTTTFYAVDGATNDFEEITITVTNAPVIPINNAPILASIGNKSLMVSNALNFSVIASDANNDPIILSASNLPPGAVFNTVTNAGGVTNSFNWASAAPVGVYTTTFYAVDGTTNDFEEITITVTNTPAVPLTGAVWNVTYNLPQQSGSGTAYPNQFRIRDALLARINALQSGNAAILSTFTFSAEDGAGAIMNAMDTALNRGAAISFIADGGISLGTVYGGTNSLLDLSTRSTNPLTLKVDGSSSGIMHDKLGLFDYGGTNQWVFTASWNFTLAASADQWNIAVEARSPDLYAIYTNETAEFLAGRFHDNPAKSHAHDGATFTLDGSWGTNFVRFAPYPDPTQGGNNAERDITNLIAQAQSEIVFALNKLNREPIRDALVAAADRGVIIKGVMPKSDTDTGNVSAAVYSHLTNSANYATTNIVQMLPAYSRADYSTLDAGESDLIHAKYMVIDPDSTNAIVIHGSANWTSEALVNDNDNDENTLFLRHNDIAASFYDHFQRITGTKAYSEGNSTLVAWDFEDANQIADGGIPANATQTVSRIPAPSSYSYTDGALSCSGWTAGANTKYWETSFTTLGHENIKASSVQLGSSTGPSDFKLQYKTSSAGTYTDVPYSDVHVPDGGNGVLTRILLPASCDNQATVFLRWIMTSDTAANGGSIGSTGAGRIDDIIITGTAYNQPPALDPIGNQSVFEGEALSFSVTASDPIDGDAITLSATNLPPGATFSGGTFTWSNASPSGVYTSTFYAVDKDGSDSETVTITVQKLPALMITEVADPAGTGGGDYRFVELYNAGSSPIILDGGFWFLSKQVNGGTTWTDTPLVGTLPAGETLVIAFDATAFQAAYGFAPDQTSGSINGTGDDAYFLYYGGDHTTGLLIDIYGALDTDGSGEAWEYTDSRAVRKTSVSQPNTVWTAAEWVVVDGATTNEMEPGIRGSLPQFQNLTDQFVLLEQSLSFGVTATDPINGNPISITASNLPSGATFDGNTFSWGSAVPIGAYNVTFTATNTDGPTTRIISITVLEKPLLILSEIADPAGSGADAYRFVELYNAGTNTIDLSTNNWTLARQNNGTDWTDVPLTGTIAADGTYVIAKGTDFDTAYGIPANQYDSSVDGNGNDTYALYYGGDHANGTLIDIYGQIDTDGADTAWDYTDSRAVRKKNILIPNSIWTVSEWTITAEATTNAMTPGSHGPTPEFQGLENPFIFLGDDLNLVVTAVNTVRTDVITLSATALPAGVSFPTNTGVDSVSSSLTWNNPSAGVYTASLSATGASGTTTTSIVITVSSSSRIAGKFYGWSLGTIFKLENGQFWQQLSYGSKTVSALNRPYVTITNHLSLGKHRMYVNGVSGYVDEVAPLDVAESGVTNSFAGLHNQNIYQLEDGTTWQQISFENISATSVETTWRWVKEGKTYLRFLDRDNVVIGTCTVIASTPPADSTIRSEIDGYFRGWQNKRVFVLKNGQFWQQIVTQDSDDTLYNPAATVTNYLGTGTWRLYVEGAGPPAYVEVRQLTNNITRTSIDGRFYGFGLRNIFHLANGSWWRQTSTESSGSIRNNPEILIWNENGTDYLEMPDEGRVVSAQQLNVFTESSISSAFRGLRYARIYSMANGWDWVQISSETIPSNAPAPLGMVWNENGKTFLVVRDQNDQTIGTCEVIDPWADDDGDGVRNVDEAIAGTSLSDRNDLFMITLGNPDPEGRIVLRWTPAFGRIYTIEWTPTLTQSFQTLETITDWTTNRWVDTINLPGSGGFYRITARLAD